MVLVAMDYLHSAYSFVLSFRSFWGEGRLKFLFYTAHKAEDLREQRIWDSLNAHLLCETLCVLCGLCVTV